MIERNIVGKLENALANMPVVALLGPRQVGKTTLIRTFANEFDNYIELNLEKEEDRAVFVSDDIQKIINASFLHLAMKYIYTELTMTS